MSRDGGCRLRRPCCRDRTPRAGEPCYPRRTRSGGTAFRASIQKSISARRCWLRDREAARNGRASGLNLLVAAIILWNTRYLQAAFDALHARGAVVTPELVRHVTPLGWEHIGLTGDYVWAADAQPSAGALRPLRDKPSLLAA